MGVVVSIDTSEAHAALDALEAKVLGMPTVATPTSTAAPTTGMESAIDRLTTVIGAMSTTNTEALMPSVRDVVTELNRYRRSQGLPPL